MCTEKNALRNVSLGQFRATSKFRMMQHVYGYAKPKPSGMISEKCSMSLRTFPWPCVSDWKSSDDNVVCQHTT